MLIVAGLQLPEIPFVEIVGNAVAAPPVQIVSAVQKSNAGTTRWLTVSAKLMLLIHSPGCPSGVKLYTAEVWLFIVAGLQVPVTPLSDVDGSAGTSSPEQITSEVPKLNTGTVI